MDEWISPQQLPVSMGMDAHYGEHVFWKVSKQNLVEYKTSNVEYMKTANQNYKQLNSLQIVT